MKQNFLLDISERSKSIDNTPSLQIQKLPFYIHSWGHFYANPSYYTEREGLDNYLLIYTLSGIGQLTYSGQQHHLVPGSAIAFNCNFPHLYQSISEELWEFKYIHFNGTATPIYNQLLNEKELNLITIDEKEHLSLLFLDIYHLLLRNDTNKDLKISSIMTAILTHLIIRKKSFFPTTKHHQYEKEIDGVIDYIHGNYHKKITCDALADQMLLSKYHFLRLFKAHTGLSPYEYLINYRIQQSKVLLKSTNYSLNIICEQIGFNDVNNYIRYFKRLVGTTPNVYRKDWF